MQQEAPLNHKIWGIAWPALLSNISVPLLGLVDTAILGHLDSAIYIGAVAVGASILAFLYWGFSFLRMGTTGLVAKAHGAGDSEGELLTLLQSAILALVIALAVIALHPLWLNLGLYWMQPGPELEPLARSYIEIRVYSAPAVLVTYTIVGWFIGRQNTRWPMLIVILTNAINIVLDVVFIVVLDWRSDGAALATLIAEYAGCAVAVAVALRSFKSRLDPALLHKLREWGRYGVLLASNRYLFVRTLCLLFSFAFFTSVSAGFGVNALAANSIMLNLLFFAAFALDGFAYAVEALAGNAVGARRMDQFYAVVRLCWHWSWVTAAGISILFLLAGPLLFPLFSQHPEVLAGLNQYHLWLVALPMVAVASYLLDGVFIGTAKSSYMMHTMLAATVLIYLPLWFLLQDLGNTGLWIAFTVFNGARGVLLWLCYRHLNRNDAWLDPAPA